MKEFGVCMGSLLCGHASHQWVNGTASSRSLAIQVNAAVSEDGALTSIGISTCKWWLLVNTRIGIDWEFNPAEVKDGLWPDSSGLSIDMQQMSATVRVQNADIRARLILGGTLSLEITLRDR